MPKPKGAQNELKMPELAIKCKNLHLVQIWAQTDQRNPWNQSWKIWCPNLMVLKMSWKHQNWLWNKKSCMWIWAKTDQPNPLNKPCKYLNAQIISNILQFYCHHSLTTIFSARWLEKLSKTSSFLTLLLSFLLNHLTYCKINTKKTLLSSEVTSIYPISIYTFGKFSLKYHLSR